MKSALLVTLLTLVIGNAYAGVPAGGAPGQFDFTCSPLKGASGVSEFNAGYGLECLFHAVHPKYSLMECTLYQLPYGSSKKATPIELVIQIQNINKATLVNEEKGITISLNKVKKTAKISFVNGNTSKCAVIDDTE